MPATIALHPSGTRSAPPARLVRDARCTPHAPHASHERHNATGARLVRDARCSASTPHAPHERRHHDVPDQQPLCVH